MSGAEQSWQRVHRSTPLLRMWAVLLAVIFSLVTQTNVEVLAALATAAVDRMLLVFGLGVAGVVVVCAVAWFISGFWWCATGFQFRDEEVALRRGIVTRTLRTARYDRIQAIDVVEPIIPRIFGLATLRVETAGGGDSVVDISYLKKARAEELRRVMLDRVHNRSDKKVSSLLSPRPEMPPQVESSADCDSAAAHNDYSNATSGDSEILVPEIPILRSILGVLLSWNFIYSVVFFVLLYLAQMSSFVIVVVVAVIGGLWKIIDKSWQFQARRLGERVELLYGLANRRRQSVVADRIHSVRMKQPGLWCIPGWWCVDVNVAGYGESPEGGTTTIVPVADRTTAISVARRIAGWQGTADHPTGTKPCDEPSDEIAVFKPECPPSSTFASPQRAWWLSPVDYKRQLVVLDDARVTIWWGRINPCVATIELAHIQEVTMRRGPFERLLGLATVRLDLVPGSVTMKVRQLAVSDARQLVNRLAQRRLPSPSKCRPAIDY